MSTDLPDFAAARDHVIHLVVDFARRLRADGMVVPANAPLSAIEALAEVGLDDRAHVRAAMHATLVHDARNVEVFDDHFPGFWYRLRSALEATATHDEVGDRAADATGSGRAAETDVDGALAEAPVDAPLDGSGDLDDETGAVRSRRVAESQVADAEQVATDQRPGTYSPAGEGTKVSDETVDSPVDRSTIRRFEQALAILPGRRWSRSRAGDVVDARRALRESLDTGGVALSVPRRERGPSAFRTCVLVDVSRSVLDAIDRGFLLSVVSTLVRDGRDVRVFFFDTDIREVTSVFAEQRGEAAAAALERADVAWGGGTRIGDSLLTLRGAWPHAVDRRTVTLVVSDGLEVGDIADLKRGLSWLARRSRAVVWLNPLATSAAYEPTCRGMAAALPYVDGLFAFGGTADLAEVARQLEAYGPGGPVGYEHDFRDRTGVTAR